MWRVTRSLYVPRDFTEEPDDFGFAPVLRWIEYQHPGRADDPKVRAELQREEREWNVRLAASQVQHVFAYRIRKKIIREGWKRAYYAQLVGQSESRINNILSGKVLMRLEDITLAHEVLGNIWGLADKNGDPGAVR